MDLLTSRPFWPLRDGLPAAFPPLDDDLECDVAIVGGGIAGAMTATLLTQAGLRVVVMDRREVAHGSTAGNTGLMLYDLDVMLHRLASRFGQERAERVYRRCRDAIAGLERIVQQSSIECNFRRRRSLQLAANRSHVTRLRREFVAREAAGLDVEWWSRGRLAAESTLPHPAAIESDAAELDPYRLTYGLLMSVRDRGNPVHDRTTVTRWKFRKRGVDLYTSRKFRVRARHLVVATGYEAEQFLPRKVGALHSTYALVTEPVAEFTGWPADRCLLWDTGEPYLYLRTTDDGRAIMGGYDEPFQDADARDRLLPAKVAALKRRFRQFFPQIPLEVATGWAGTFGVSADGMPFIGAHRDVPHTWFALGFGGNGTTFAMIAAEVIREALFERTDPDAGLFGFDR